MKIDEWCVKQFISGHDKKLFIKWLTENGHSLEESRTELEWWKFWEQFMKYLFN
jgi:hypothetical protein